MATYYIDFSAGDDTHAGTAEGTAWKTIPGTRLADNSNWRSTDWGSGTFNSTNKIPAGTIFRLKPGTTMDSSNGGMVWITSTYYATNATIANPITIEAYQAWSGATGTVTFDGTGITLGGTGGWGLIHITVGGLYFDGNVTDGITIQDSTWRGISGYNGSSAQPGISGSYLKFYNNGTASSSDATGAAEGQFSILDAVGGSLDHCEFDGNNQFINGIHFGESNKAVTGFTISDCNTHDHNGSDDCGIGIKAQNSQTTITGITTHDNYKGVDIGEISGNNRNITHTFINCIAYNNGQAGFAVNSAGASGYSGAVNFTFVNCISRDNTDTGFMAYSGPFNVYWIHCIADNNGSGGSERSNFMWWHDTNDGAINVTIYNSIGYKPAGVQQMTMLDWHSNSNQVVDSDYNCWVQRAAEQFALWDYFNGVAQANFTYGEGPGGAGCNWYDWYGATTTPPAAGTGHYHCDANSVITAPPFTDVANHNYALTTTFPGTDISGKPWYTADMGIDTNGRARAAWDMGSYEYADQANPYVRVY